MVKKPCGGQLTALQSTPVALCVFSPLVYPAICAFLVKVVLRLERTILEYHKANSKRINTEKN